MMIITLLLYNYHTDPPGNRRGRDAFPPVRDEQGWVGGVVSRGRRDDVPELYRLFAGAMPSRND